MTRGRACPVACAVIVVLGAGRTYGNWTWTTLDFPGAFLTEAAGVSGDNIVGFFFDGNLRPRAFLCDGATWTALDYPGADGTAAWDIDGNKIVGWYADGLDGYGFLYDGTTWTTLDFPGASSSGAWGIDGNNIVGWYYDSNIVCHGFLYDGTTWTRLDFPGAIKTEATGIDGNNIIGFYVDSNGVGHGFLYNGTTWTALNYPGAVLTGVFGIDGNNIVGEYAGGGRVHRFLYDGKTWTTLDYPGEGPGLRFGKIGISGNTIVGSYMNNAGTVRALLLRVPKLTLTVINPPWGSVDVEPNQPFYIDANFPVTLTATPIDGRCFDRWTIYDPNHPGDANYASSDANTVLHLIMEGDYQVEATFKCAGGLGPILPFGAIGLLGMFYLRRR